MRTIVDLSAEDVEALKELCRREKISRAEAVRRAVKTYLRSKSALRSEDAFGIWRDREDVEGRAYEDRLRDEWDACESSS
jgi:metal-responsive CopG/Arc/MetJ family transcriptional regulator